MNIIAVTQARIGSSRLPAKVLLDVGGQPMLAIHLERILRSKCISKLIVATTLEPETSTILDIAENQEVSVYQGSTEDVLDRFYQAVLPYTPQYVVRLTADCPLIDPILIDKVIQYAVKNQLDYCSNTLIEKYPDGQDIEIFTFQSLEKAWNEAKLPSEREHVTPYIRKNSTFNGGDMFKSDNFNEDVDLSQFRMTVDEPADLEFIRQLVSQLGPHASMDQYIALLRTKPALLQINSKIQRNEGYEKSLCNDNEF